jgi:hypothetical protein
MCALLTLCASSLAALLCSAFDIVSFINIDIDVFIVVEPEKHALKTNIAICLYELKVCMVSCDPHYLASHV